MLSIQTIEKYFMPIIEIVPSFLENLTDDELKKKAKNDLSTIIKAIKCLVSRIPSQQETAKSLEIFRLKMILRLLQISSFNGKMNALNEVNKVIANVSYHPHRHGQSEDEEWLTAERMAEWIKDNRVLQIVLKDSLHQPQYVNKLEKIIRFIIKGKTLTLDDLDDVWAAQHGKHEAIVKNVHDLLAKLAWDFSPEQLDHLFRCFQTSWSQASKKQREKLLELIRRLAEDDKDGVMAHKVLNLLWSLAHSDDVPTEIMDQVLSAHVKILDYSCLQDRDSQKHHWLDRCVEELKHDKWVLPALKQIREICCSYSEAPPTVSQHQRPAPHVNYRNDVIAKLQNQHSLVIIVADNLTAYMKNISLLAKEKPDIGAADILPDGRYNHIAQVQERLSFVRFLLKDGQLWLCAPQAKQIWNCLAENAVFTVDRESCFKWFSKLMGDDPDLDPEISKEFFESNILLLDPSFLTEHGMRCFDRFFKAVNSKEGKLLLKRRTYLVNDVYLIGIDYLWRVVVCSSEDIAQKAIELLKETFTNLGPRLQANQHEVFFFLNCITRLRTSWSQASKKQREKLLELIRRLAEDDKDGVMAHKVLNLLWSLAHSDDVPTEIMDQVLSAHVKILDYSCLQDRDSQKHHWLDRCVEELKHDKWVLPALKQIREICCSYSEAPLTVSQHQGTAPHVNYRNDVIAKLQNQHSLVILVADNLTTYMKNISLLAKEKPDIGAADILPDGRYNHIAQVQERLSFVRFLLKDGQLWLCAPQAKQIWNCLAENAVFTEDRESCFKWFFKLMGDDPDLDPEISKEFFESNILLLDPSFLTEHGMRCFDRFFKAVNSKEGKLLLKRRTYLVNDVYLIGIDYLWRVVVCSSEDIAQKAIELLKETFTNLGPRLQANQHEVFFFLNCITRLRTSWSQASKKQKEMLLELIRRLAEDDKDGVMAHEVLNLLWSLAHLDDVPTEIMDQALSAHVKILDYSCLQDRDAQKHHWLDRCVEELKHDKWVLPALKQIREICCSYSEAPPTVSQHQRPAPHVNYRHDVIALLQNLHSLVILVADNLTAYMKNISLLAKEKPDIVAADILPDGRYNHIAQVQERLSFLRFLLKDGHLWLCAPQANQIWNCLAENAVFTVDRESCFEWFCKLMGDDPDLDPEISKEFFETNILLLDPSFLTEHGLRCFDRFFKAVNSKEGKLLLKRRTYLMDDVDLIGIDYIWRVVLCSSEDIAQKAIELLKETFTNLGPRLQANQVLIHEDFILNCMTRLRTMYDTVSVLNRDKDSTNKVRQETTRMCRVLKVLYEYVSECDGDFGDDRTILPLARASRGKQLSLIVRFPVQGRQPDELEVWVHTNDTMGSVKRQVMHRLKSSAANVKVELYQTTDTLEPLDDKKIIAHMPLRDKVILIAKLTQVGGDMASSSDSSSDSSTGSSQHPYEGSNVEAESCLSGVIMANQTKYCQFLLQLADLGSSLNLSTLRDGARMLLNLIPADQNTVAQIEALCMDHSKGADESVSPMLESTMFSVSLSTVLYNLQVLYSLLMPALNPITDKALEFQYNFMRSGGVKLVINMLTKNNFLSNADMATKRSALLVVLKIAKLVFVTVGYAIVALMAGSISSGANSANSSPVANAGGSSVNYSNGVEGESKTETGGGGPSLAIIQVPQQALQHIPNPASDCMVRNVASRLAQSLHDQVTTTTCLWSHFMSGMFPDKSVVRSILKAIWASASGHLHLMTSPLEEIESAAERFSSKTPDAEDLQVCSEGLETLSVVLALYPPALEALSKETQFHKLVLSLVVYARERVVRLTAVEQMLLIATKCAPSAHTFVVFIMMLFNVLNGHQKVYSKEYFQLLCGLLSWACVSKVALPGVERLLAAEVEWLKGVRQKVLKAPRGTTDAPTIDEVLLEGHLFVTRELVAFLPPEKKWELGGENKNINLIRELIEDFIFPFSKVYFLLEHSSVIPAEQAIPVCSSQSTVIAAYDLLVTLCTGCVQNLNSLANMLTNMFYSDCEESLGEWEYLPPVGPRPHKGFVGLKNAGATCYMNSVLQQLYMIKPVREGVLSVEGAATDPDEDFSGEERPEHENNMEVTEDDGVNSSNEESRKEYHIGILKQVQAIFAHLACSKLQYYVPRGLWKHFKLQGEPVNLREQHDACEFYNILVESINEALKALGKNQILNEILGGFFSDQKICKTCPHRYSREEAFTVISIDIRNYSNLYDSLEQYVKGDLLEGDNAYLCEKCDKKVDTVKRICLKKLPPILAIQLKRFDYDWERECSIKFNDYFEFPRELDMEPYTVAGLARNGELIDYDSEDLKNQSCSKYKLTGIAVHSGQASGGHYYSYILHKAGSEQKWYKFDDGDVTECKMDDDEEMKNQCFGGEYMGERVFDNIMKRVSYRRQKRWWNAYLLFYTRLDDSLVSLMSDLTLADCPGLIKMPPAIERSVVRQNVRFLHSRSQFSPEYFQFLKNLILANHSFVSNPPQDRVNESEEVAMISTKLASKFLFSVGLHTKKTLRGPAQEWYEALQVHLRSSAATRGWFTQHVLFAQPHRFMEYLLECPAPEVRLVFSKLIVLVAHCSKSDPPQPLSWAPLKHLAVEGVASCSLSDQLLIAVLLLLNKEVSEHGRHLLQYFHLFHLYASFGPAEKLQLLKLNVVETLMLVALDEGPGPAIKYQYPELGKLYQVVSQLIRCCDVSHKCQSSQPNKPPLPNPHGDNTIQDPLMPIQQKVADILYGRPTYVKKIIEDSNTSEDTLKLLKFCCWENPMFSSIVLSELLWKIAFVYTYKLRPYFDLLLHMLLLEDSWQDHRIHNALKGIPEERDGLFETMLWTKNRYQKRAYQCIKCMVALFANCKAANRMLNTNEELRRKWSAAVYWLNNELDRRPYYTANQQYYNNWSPQAPSNETSNGYFLERSPSARSTLEKAYELCPEEIEGDECEEGEPALPEEMAPPPPTPTPCDHTAAPAHTTPTPTTNVAQPQTKAPPTAPGPQPALVTRPGSTITNTTSTGTNIGGSTCHTTGSTIYDVDNEPTTQTNESDSANDVSQI